MKLKDKIALVTGAGSGIGAAIALTYAREGAKVVIADLDPKSAETIVAKIVQSGGAAISVVMDVSQEDEVNAGVEKAIAAYGAIDIVVK